MSWCHMKIALKKKIEYREKLKFNLNFWLNLNVKKTSRDTSNDLMNNVLVVVHLQHVPKVFIVYSSLSIKS